MSFFSNLLEKIELSISQRDKKMELNIFASSKIKVDYFDNGGKRNRPLIVTFTAFSSSGKTELNGVGYAGDFLLKKGYRILAFKNADNDWYAGFTDDALMTVRNFLAQKRFKSVKRIGYGSSMGAYAAIKFSKSLGLTSVMGYSPQVSIVEDFDTRWIRYSSAVSNNHGIVASDIARECKYFFVYDPYDKDKKHISEIASLAINRNIKTLEIPFSGHPAIYFFNEVGLVKDAVECVIQKEELLQFNGKIVRKKSPTYLFNLASRLCRTGHVRVAEKIISNAIEIDGRRAGFFRLRSNINDRLGKIDLAISDAMKSVEIDPGDSYGYKNLALLLMTVSRLNEAKSAIDKAIEHSPKVIVFYQIRAQICIKDMQQEEALVTYRAALKIDSKNKNLLNQFLKFLLSVDNYEEAIDVVKCLVSIEPNNISHLTALSKCLYECGKVDDAIFVLENAIKIDPISESLAVELSDMLNKSDRHLDAVNVLLLAIDRTVSSARIYVRLFSLYSKVGNKKAAKICVEDGIKFFPNDLRLIGLSSRL